MAFNPNFKGMPLFNVQYQYLRDDMRYTQKWYDMSLGWSCTSPCMARHWIICLSCAHRSLKLLNDSIFIPPAAIYSFHDFSSICMAVAPSLSLDQRHGTCSKTICISQTCKLTVFIVHWRRFFLNSTLHIEQIKCIIFATMRYINGVYIYTHGYHKPLIQSVMWPIELCYHHSPMTLIAESKCSLFFWSLMESPDHLRKGDIAIDLEWSLKPTFLVLNETETLGSLLPNLTRNSIFGIT